MKWKNADFWREALVPSFVEKYPGKYFLHFILFGLYAQIMNIDQLNPNPHNPRIVTDDKLDILRKTITEFGDLSGFVYNRRTKRLVSGHQRLKILPKGSKINILKSYSKPSPTGTITLGYVVVSGESFVYREVDWDEIKEKAAAIAANQNAGEWDQLKLRDWLKDIEDDGLFDLDLTLFSAVERKRLFRKFEVAAQKKTDDSDDEPKEKKRVECPECHHRFVPGWSS